MFDDISLSLKMSVAFALAFIVTLIMLFLKTKKSGNSKGISFLSLTTLLLALFCFRINVAEEEFRMLEMYMLNTDDIYVYGFVETLRTFCLDSDYSMFISAVKAVFGEAMFWSIYASALFLIAPITGGAVLLEMITSIFPRVKLFICNHVLFWKEVLYFSELNEQSLALAKSIKAKYKSAFKSLYCPVIVFTDVYTDKEENSTELLLSAKALGAVCISDDLLHTRIRIWHRKKLFLIDKNEINNIQALSKFSDDKYYKALKKTGVYLFSNDDTFALVGSSIKEQLKGKFKAEEDLPRIITINGYRNLVRNLLSDVPLYEPLIGRVKNPRTDKYELNVTIIGAGEIGTEMFLSTYWYGQLLNCRLCINVVSQEPESAFVDKINYINPDIFRSADASDNILRIYPHKDDLAEPYFKFRYFRTNIKDDDLKTKLTGRFWDESFRLIDSDYFVIALGSDEDNLSVAEKINRFVKISGIEAESVTRSVIAYVIYDAELSRVLNKAVDFNSGVYMHAFGSLDEVYNTKNIFMENIADKANKIGNTYDILAQRAIRKIPDELPYDYWSDVARALHIRYKVFSAGQITSSVFTEKNETTRSNKLNDDFESYKKAVEADAELCKQLSWLEHRRWNAFMRSTGFTCPTDFDKFAEKSKSHKNLSLKLHACLVECDKNGMRNNIFADNKGDIDMLDKVSRDVYFKLKKKEKTNYKKYDYPEYDF